MSPALNGSSTLECFERSNASKIHNGIMFDFYPGLPHLQMNYMQQTSSRSSMVDMPDNDKSVSTTYYPLLLLNRVLLVKKTFCPQVLQQSHTNQQKEFEQNCVPNANGIFVNCDDQPSMNKSCLPLTTNNYVIKCTGPESLRMRLDYCYIAVLYILLHCTYNTITVSS